MFSKLNLSYIFLCVGILELLEARFHHKVTKNHLLYNFGWELRCKLQPHSWHCYRNQSTIYEFYYDVAMQACKSFDYGGCDLAFNSFNSVNDCYETCDIAGKEPISPAKAKILTMEVTCRMQQDFGSCSNYIPSYYYDISTRTCKGFSYSGCGGNGNKFETKNECMEACETIMPTFTTG